MTDITIGRTGKPPLSFSGELLATETSQESKGYLYARHHVLTVYQTTSGKLVLHIEYTGSRKYREPGHVEALVVSDASALPAALEKYDPLERVIGYPAGEQFTESQRKLLEHLQTGYYGAVGRLLAKCGVAERVE